MTDWGRAVRRIAGAAATAAMLVPGAAHAVPSWTADPLPVFPRTADEGAGTTSNRAEAVGMSDRGEVVVLLDRITDTTNDLAIAARPPGGAVGAPQTVTTESRSAAALAVAPDGTVLVVWASGAPARLRYAVRPPGGVVGPAQDVPGGDRYYAGLHVASDAAGTMTIAWASSTGPETVVKALRRSAGGTFGAVEPLSGTNGTQDVDLAVNAQGDVLVAFGEGFHVNAALRPAGASAFSPAVQIGADGAGGIGGIAAALGRDGSAGVVWWQYLDDGSGGGNQTRVRAVVRRPSGVFSARQSVSAPANPALFFGDIDLAFDANGGAEALWMRESGSSYILERAVLAPGATAFGPPLDLGEGTTGLFDVSLAADAQGRLLSTYRTAPSPPYLLKVGVQPDAATAPTVVLGAPGSDVQDPVLAADGRGNGAVAFTDSRYHGNPGDPPNAVRVVGFDGAGPLLDGLQLPAGGVAGDALSFGVAPLDVWSPVASTRWSFGDGATADTATPAHVYAAAGSYPVSVTATDARGNATTSATANAVITARPVVPPPADVTPPRISGLSLLRSRFRVGAAPTAVSARAAAGTVFRLTLDEGATVRIVIARELPGRRVRGRCRATGPRTARRCTRVVAKGTLTRVLPAGAARVAFSGRIGRRALAVGRYRATISATDAAGNRRTVKPLRFRVVRR